MDKISIIIPVYNGEKYLNECLDSIINQDYKNIEIIIVNDGSIDNTLKICKEYKEKDKRIKLINNTNHGVSYSRNQALLNSTGKYIVFIDADDYIKNNYISTLYYNLKNNNSQCSICSRYSDKNETVKNIFEKNYSENLIYLLFTHFGGFITDKMYVKKIIDDNKILFNEKIHIEEDMLFNVDYFKQIKKVTFTNEKLYFYRKYLNSSYNDLKNIKWFSVLDTYNILLKKTKLYDKNITNIINYNYYMILIEAKYRIKYINDETIKKKIMKLYDKEIKIKNVLKLDKKIKILIFMVFPKITMMYKRKKVR